MIRIDSALCELCGTCVGVCPADAIVMEMNSIRIEQDRCISCGACVQVCPVGAVGKEQAC
ncbi:MAG: 4Fe-4S binding protein [Candidatus Latescibacterota bacterium]